MIKHCKQFKSPPYTWGSWMNLNPNNLLRESQSQKTTKDLIYLIQNKQIFIFILFNSFIYLLLFRATPSAYVGSQVRGPTGATDAGLHHRHSNIKSKLHLRPTPELMATLDP